MIQHHPSARRRGLSSAFAALAGLGLLGFVLPACAGQSSPSKAAPAGSDAVAEVNGQKITMDELEKASSGQLSQLEKQRYQILESNLTKLVDDKIVEMEAKSRGVEKAALLENEVQKKVQDVTDGDVAGFYEQNKQRMGGRSLEQIAPQIKQYLTQQRSVEARENFMKTLREKYSVKVILEPPRVEVAEADSPAKGPANAPVKIVEFSDFQCPFCSRVAPDLKKVVDNFGDKVRFVYRQFPLSIHPFAQKAAEASLCANEQGKFWEMYEAMFGNQQALGVDQLKAKSGDLGMDKAKFASCLDSGKFAGKISADIADGTKAGVTGTPALFVNGRFLNGAVPYPELEKIINDELSRKGIKVAKPAAAAK